MMFRLVLILVICGAIAWWATAGFVSYTFLTDPNWYGQKIGEFGGSVVKGFDDVSNSGE